VASNSDYGSSSVEIPGVLSFALEFVQYLETVEPTTGDLNGFSTGLFTCSCIMDPQ
jgi:hypothetical protein